MKKFIVIVAVVILTAVPASALMSEVGTTYQSWDFKQQSSPYGILPDQDSLDNPYPGSPVAIINDLYGEGVEWRDDFGNGAWIGEEFKIVLDIPNNPVTNDYKDLTLKMRYQGLISFQWIVDDNNNRFELISEDYDEDETDPWKTVTQVWHIEPNPRQELVVIGLQCLMGAPAVLDSISVRTVCAPEPGTLALLGLGIFGMMRGKRKDI